MDQVVTIEFTKPFRFRGSIRSAGEQIETSRQNAKVLVVIGKAKLVTRIEEAECVAEVPEPIAPAPVEQPEAQEPEPEVEPDLSSDKPRRRGYRRRDMTPDEAA